MNAASANQRRRRGICADDHTDLPRLFDDLSLCKHPPGLGLFATSLNHDHLDGAVTPVFDKSRFNQISVRRLDDDMLEVLEMKDGDVIVGSFWTFSRDGQSFIRRGVGKALTGGRRPLRSILRAAVQ